MGRKKGVGIPYLKSSLKYTWNSSVNLDKSEIDDILGNISEHLLQNGLSANPVASTSSAATDCGKKKRRLALTDSKNEMGCVGLQAVLSGMANQQVCCAVFDSDVLKASAIASAIGLYAHRRGTEAIGLTSASSTLCDLLKDKLVALRVHVNSKSDGPFLKPPVTQLSTGKEALKKMKKKKKKLTIE